MPYTEPTLAQAQADLASRLNDPGFVHWTSVELARYIREALRTWNSFTSHWREVATFQTVILQPFYDLTTVLPTLRGQTVTNWDLVLDIQYTLLEPPSAAVWTGTDQFTLAQVSNAIQRRRDQFLWETGAILTRTETAYAAPPATGRIALDEDVLTVRRAAWRPDATQFLRVLIRGDEWGANHFAPTWPSTTTAPSSYSVSATPPLTLQLIPPASSPGTLDLIAIQRGVALSSGVEASLGMPDDWTWVVKFGALADLLLGDGLALDVPRGTYCQQRWEQGLELAKKASVVLAGRINNVPTRLNALADADNYSPMWQLLGGTPVSLLLAGQNLVGTWPPAGAVGGPWTIGLDVVRNAPVPVLPGDILQIGQDVYDAVLDYGQHLALSKEGPGELEASLGLLNRFARAAGVDLQIQQASQPSREPLMTQTRTDEHALPRELDAVAVE